MSRTIMLIPIGDRVGLTSIKLGIIHAMKRKGINPYIFDPIIQSPIPCTEMNCISTIVQEKIDYRRSKMKMMNYIESLLFKNQKDTLMEEIITNYYENIKGRDAEVVLMEGLVLTKIHQLTYSLNYEISKMLNAEIIFVISQEKNDLEKIKERIESVCISFDCSNNTNIIGIIINKLNAIMDNPDFIYLSDMPSILDTSYKTQSVTINEQKLIEDIPIPVLGTVPWRSDLTNIRVIDIAQHLNALVINEGDIKKRRVKSIVFCTNSDILHTFEYFYTSSMLVISEDRFDILFTACLAVINGANISAILLTGSHQIDNRARRLCENAFATGLTVLMVKTNICQLSLILKNLNSLSIPSDDIELIEKVQEHIANYISTDWFSYTIKTSLKPSRFLTPTTFCFQLTELARKANKCIILPEGNEPRIVKSASICADRGIANCVLLGNPDEIHLIANSQGINLNDNIKIINPDLVRENYIDRLVELRKRRGMTRSIAQKKIEDNIILSTLMLEQNEVDGLVSGAIHTTANTVRPSLQLIKTAPGNSLVSSIFFMLFPETVYIYGDCAINLDPNAEELAEIAIQSASSAITFGIDPYIAMLSYSTGKSGTGSNVEKVCEATRLVREKRPDLIIDGPLQYDTAVMDEVAELKAPNSPVAGKANVFIFPDLNSGNITYKAVQRSSNLISIGPVLQGMRKPVNDLSRGAMVNDIVYTIALTAIQAT